MQKERRISRSRKAKEKEGGCVLVYYRMNFRRRGKSNIDAKVGIWLFAVSEKLRRVWGFPEIILLSGDVAQEFLKRLNNGAKGTGRVLGTEWTRVPGHVTT